MNIPKESGEAETQNGFTEEELNDPNAIKVTIEDPSLPIIVLFGPPACGKTMTLIRLARFLQAQSYNVVPVESFRPKEDKAYAKMCEKFDNMVNSTDAAKSTSMISFMLVKVLDNNSNPICQILEAPGEHYFNPSDRSEPNTKFPAYINEIVGRNNRKVWCYMLEPKWNMQNEARTYAEKIRNMKKTLRKNDKAIFVLNKVDVSNYVTSPGRVNMKAMRKHVENIYPNIFIPFRRKNLIFGMFDDFKLIPFQTGTYTRKLDGEYSYQDGPDEYPKLLWETILKLIR